MSFLVSAEDEAAIDFAPATVTAEVMQNIRTIITTIKYSVPLDRGFGIDGSIVDLPMEVAKAKMTNEIFKAIRQYEPRASIESITFTGEDTGKLVPTVEVKINETS
ncbi:GPW/gp25 family protein [Selenomonas ruminantium]|jgi:phage baseplate assembly protein W|uniref:IraD/Gp25-like domain-containing protein n=1 Tax=Selenomonas ruminantium TaxID=971 RepID=A0A1H0P8L6_SELRU|nr:GPW/gp25 family protein [Selenomonas ruminantium]SDP01028.1 hypothetical protein SAMN05216366_104147 [Selenomonas ruminantium]